MDSRVTRRGGLIDDYFNDFCDRIFAMPWLRHSIKLMTCERNTGQEAGRLASQFLQRSNVHCITQKKGSDYGWTTGPGGTSKNKYAAALMDAFNRDGVVYAKELICSGIAMDDNDDTAENRIKKIQPEFEAQLTRMQTFIDAPDDPYGKIRSDTSGKRDPEGKFVVGLNDDLAMSFAMNIYIIHQLISGRIDTIESSFLKMLLFGR